MKSTAYLTIQWKPETNLSARRTAGRNAAPRRANALYGRRAA